MIPLFSSAYFLNFSKLAKSFAEKRPRRMPSIISVEVVAALPSLKPCDLGPQSPQGRRVGRPSQVSARCIWTSSIPAALAIPAQSAPSQSESDGQFPLFPWTLRRYCSFRCSRSWDKRRSWSSGIWEDSKELKLPDLPQEVSQRKRKYHHFLFMSIYSILIAINLVSV